MAAGDRLNDDVKTIVERRKASLDYLKPVHEEWEKAWRAVNCKTEPIYVINEKGQKVEDDSRTNVCMPWTSITHRKNTARLTANAPNVKYISKKAPDVATKLTGWSYLQFDRSGEALMQRLNVQQAEIFGISPVKHFWNSIGGVREFRYRTAAVDRRFMLELAGAGEDQILAEIATLGEQLSEVEKAQLAMQYGPEIVRKVQTKRYEGPVSKLIFAGDMFFEPGASILNPPDWEIEEYEVNETFFEYWADKTYKDPETGEEIPVMDKDAVQKMLDTDSRLSRHEKDSLRERLREIMGQPADQSKFRKLNKSKLFRIYECHETREDGRKWVVWIGNEKHKLGQMPYQADFNGRSAYSYLTPLPNLISLIGDSTPRLGRFLHDLDNIAVGQTVDYVNQVLRPMLLSEYNSDIKDEAVERKLFKEILVKRIGSHQFERIPTLPAEAWEMQAMVQRRQAMLDPAAAGPDLAGTNANPGTGRTATVGVLASRERDTLTQYKVDSLNLFHRDSFEKKLALLQKHMQEPLDVTEYMKTEAVSMRSGNAERFVLDPYEIQEDFEVQPEAGSTLAVDDQFRRMEVERGYQLAVANPDVWDVNYMAKKYAETMYGVEPHLAVKPPAPPPTTPPAKVTFSVSAKFEEQPADVKNQLLEMAGMQPSTEFAHEDTLKGVVKIGAAADAAAKLNEPAVPKEEPRKTMASKA